MATEISSLDPPSRAGLHRFAERPLKGPSARTRDMLCVGRLSRAVSAAKTARESRPTLAQHLACCCTRDGQHSSAGPILIILAHDPRGAKTWQSKYAPLR